MMSGRKFSGNKYFIQPQLLTQHSYTSQLSSFSNKSSNLDSRSNHSSDTTSLNSDINLVSMGCPIYFNNLVDEFSRRDDAIKYVLEHCLLFFNYPQRLENKALMMKHLNRLVPQTRGKILYIINGNENHYLLKSPKEYLFKSPYVFRTCYDNQKLINSSFVIFASKNLVKIATKSLNGRIQYYRPNRPDSYEFVTQGMDCKSIHLSNVANSFNSKLNGKFCDYLTQSYKLYNKHTVHDHNIDDITSFERKYKKN